MPRADVKPLSTGPGWGCNCPAFRLGEPTPEQALAALARSVRKDSQGRAVTVDRRGDTQYRAWTDPKSAYNIVFDPQKSGGWCKHIIACLVYWAPWHRQLALGADDALAEIKSLRKELKKREREIRKLRG